MPSRTHPTSSSNGYFSRFLVKDPLANLFHLIKRKVSYVQQGIVEASTHASRTCVNLSSVKIFSFLFTCNRGLGSLNCTDRRPELIGNKIAFYSIWVDIFIAFIYFLVALRLARHTHIFHKIQLVNKPSAQFHSPRAPSPTLQSR